MIPSAIRVIGDLPEDRSQLNSWFAELIGKDAKGIQKEVRTRLSKNASEELAPLIQYVSRFIPHRLHFRSGVGFVICVDPSSREKSVFKSKDFFVIAQPTTESLISERVKYFDESIRSLMHEFMSKFDRCGEEMEPVCSGQFALNRVQTAQTWAYSAQDNLGPWKDAVLLYATTSGDSVLINRYGATAWHDHETNDIIPLSDTFPRFIKHFVRLHEECDVIDSYASRELGIE